MPLRFRLPILFSIAFTFALLRSGGQTLYFPPLNNSAPWDSLSPASLGWCPDRIDSLYRFLSERRTKAFIVLKDGKRVLEKYFGTFTQDSAWYWASAGKTITAFLTGKAQEDGFLRITDTSSRYLGAGWTNCTPAQEQRITIRNQLTMTSGLDDGVPENHCTIDTCLNYLAEPGTRWAYHNAPYTLLDPVLTAATGLPLNTYTQNVLKSKTGMTGQWFTIGYNNVFYSRARSMARFGLLVQNNCIWRTDTLLRDSAYVRQMVNTSQTINRGYGYLWWLNGRSSYMVPTLQLVFPGSYAPAAPYDMYAGLGKNGQILSVAPSKGLVVVRMGESPDDTGEVPTELCNNIWERLNYVMCSPVVSRTYTFIGNGNWSQSSNWEGGLIPPALLPNGDQIVINPVPGGECLLNTSQTIPRGSILRVVAGKRFRIQGNLSMD